MINSAEMQSMLSTSTTTRQSQSNTEYHLNLGWGWSQLNFGLIQTNLSDKEKLLFQIIITWYGPSYSFLFLNSSVLELLGEQNKG